jgi:hypothetical protein
MSTESSRPGAIARVFRLIALAGALFISFTAGAWFSPSILSRSDSAHDGTPETAKSESAAFDPSKGFPNAAAPRPVDPREPEPRAVELRAAAIQHDLSAIQAECQQAAGGDWEKWNRDTASYRSRFKRDLEARLQPGAAGLTQIPQFPLQGRDDFPLFELDPGVHLFHLYDDTALDSFRKNRSVVAAQRWLHGLGIDLIFVALPKMTEVYIEHFLEPCPGDGIIAPHARLALLELLKEDVEIVDGFRLFRPTRDFGGEYLYNTADSHWAPRGTRIMAKEIADRIERYRFGSRARVGLPIVTASPGLYVFDGHRGGIGSVGGWSALSSEQQARARRAQTTTLSEVRMPDGSQPPDDPTSPVLLIGNSYVDFFREQLIRELNMLVHTRANGGQTTEAFADFLREPALLGHCRVVVWITTEQHMTHFHAMPAPIMAALQAGR